MPGVTQLVSLLVVLHTAPYRKRWIWLDGDSRPSGDLRSRVDRAVVTP